MTASFKLYIVIATIEKVLMIKAAAGKKINSCLLLSKDNEILINYERQAV